MPKSIHPTVFGGCAMYKIETEDDIFLTSNFQEAIDYLQSLPSGEQATFVKLPRHQ